MMGRHELREQVFRLLFRVEFHSPQDMVEQRTGFKEELPAEDTGNAIDEENSAKIVARCEKVQEKLSEIDKVINDNTEGWDTVRMGKVELAILRLAAYEILYDEDIPDSVAINEAVEIAKKYGQESSGAFVNAVLGKIVKSNERDS